MSKPVKVYNKGTRPIVFKRDLTGTDAIHPGKFLTFHLKKAAAIIEKFGDACSEDDFKIFIAKVAKEIKEANDKAAEEHEKHLKEVAKKQKDIEKEAAIEAKKKAETESKK